LVKKRRADGRALRGWRGRVERDKNIVAAEAAQNRKRELWTRLESLGYNRN